MGISKEKGSDTLKGVSTSKIEKKKLKNWNKKQKLKSTATNIKNVAASTISTESATTAEVTNGLKKKLKLKNKNKKNETSDNQQTTAATSIKPIAGTTNDISKKLKNKKNKQPGNAAAVAATAVAKAAAPGANVLTEADLARIAKKKAKKAAQKLRKKQQATNKVEGQQSQKPNAAGQGTKEAKTAKSPKVTAGKQQQTKILKKNNNKSKQKPNEGNSKPSKANRDPADEASTVFVGNLPINTKAVQIKQLFKNYGYKRMRVRTAAGLTIFKHKQRLQAGSLNAYVVLESPEAAERALELNGTEFKSHHLRVTKSKDKPGNDELAEMDRKRTIFIGNLKYSVTEEKLREIFSSCGALKYVRCLQDAKGCKGVAYVCFESNEAVGLALELDGTMLDERPIHVEVYKVDKLGAKAKRDKETANVQKTTGAAKRLHYKEKKNNVQKDNAQGADKKKKSEYRGVKIAEGTTGGIKKKQKKQKSKFNPMLKLAKKLAPKENKQD